MLLVTLGLYAWVKEEGQYTKIDLRVVIHGNIDFLMGLIRTAVICRHVVVGKDLARLLDEFMAFYFELLAISKLSSICTTAMVIILRRGRR
jgi:hypothetical protein